MTCGPRTTEGAAEADVPGVGRVRLLDVGDPEVAVSVAIETPRGLFVAPEVVFEGGSGEVHDFLKGASIHPGRARGTFDVTMGIQRFETVWTDESKPRYQQPTREVKVRLTLTCAVPPAKGPVRCVRNEPKSGLTPIRKNPAPRLP